VLCSRRRRSQSPANKTGFDHSTDYNDLEMAGPLMIANQVSVELTNACRIIWHGLASFREIRCVD
jgi:hypothetical protein